ncbi:MAG: ATP-dependent Clp protease proteolytic subunit [Myxococcota bacterium]
MATEFGDVSVAGPQQPQVPITGLPPQVLQQIANQASQQAAIQSAKTHYVSFSAEVVPHTIESLLALCADLVNKHQPDEIYLALNTPGGQVACGIGAYNMLRALPVKIITHNVGAVDSIGNVIFLAGDQRYCCSNAGFMFHGVGFDINGQNLRLERKLLGERLDALQADERKIASIISDRTEMTDDQVEESFLNQVTRDPDFAKSNGIVHEVRDLDIPKGAPIYQLVFQRQGVVVR